MQYNIEIEALPAYEGDCILVKIIDQDLHILIDGGTRETYSNYLKKCLVQLKNKGKQIDLLVVTHIDNDHIGGIIELLKENISNEKSEIINIKNIWFNSYRHLQINKSKKLGKQEKNILERIIANGEINLETYNGENQSISALQGTTLAALILTGGYSWNKHFHENAVINNGVSYQISNECSISVLLPNKADLDNLGRKWKRELIKSKCTFEFSDDVIFDDAFEHFFRFMQTESYGKAESISYNNDNFTAQTVDELASVNGVPDSSITNRTSISLMINCKKDKLLFPADNYGDNIIDNMKEDDYACTFVKLPHHGSIKNNTDHFIDTISCKTYLVSTNSDKYNHPDIETLAKLVRKRTDYVKQIFFNYRIKKVENFEKTIEKYEDVEFIYLEKGQKIYL